MRRRGFILGFAAGAALRPVAGDSPGCAPAGGRLSGRHSKAMAERYFGGFLQGMQELGYSEGRNWTLESRFLSMAMSLARRCLRKSCFVSSLTYSWWARWRV